MRFAWFVVFVLSVTPAHAQHVMENLGRGVVAVRSAERAAYVGWRLLATDPEGVGFNLYRSAGAETPVRLNASVLMKALAHPRIVVPHRVDDQPMK